MRGSPSVVHFLLSGRWREGLWAHLDKGDLKVVFVDTQVHLGDWEGDGRGGVYGGGREKGGGEEVEGKEEGRGGREEGDGWRG